jgi:hypothetical protein
MTYTGEGGVGGFGGECGLQLATRVLVRVTKRCVVIRSAIDAGISRTHAPESG